MCLVCIDFSSNKLTLEEAKKNLGEMKEKIGEEHYQEVSTMLQKKQIEKFWEIFYKDVDSDDEEYWEKIGFGD